ncbi:hypothetical protein OG705_01435 [Streptomyces sp. NBC_00838]|uniref:hypothetical protein n=1 Tax=Streptomyces sp. NBC_00838 TaxID=2903680 RepID=UPI00386BDEAE|nr:hypothetical protein OG705_01435 [Streptomyces sp. NBC_00838]
MLRAGVIRAARYDRRDGDLPLLRLLLERETSERTEGARDWARAMDADSCGRDPEAESEFTWIELARAQGRIEHARVALIRLLDDAGPADAELLGRLSASLERLGDHAQAARAQFFFLSLQDTDRDRAVAACDLARLERRKGDLAAARRALERARTAVRTVPQWHRHGLGRLITEQHLELALAAAEAGDAPLARETMALGRELLSTIARQHAKALSELSTRAKWAVAALGRDQG